MLRAVGKQVAERNKCWRSFCSVDQPVWGLLADTHFKEQSLDKIIDSTSWAIDMFKENNVSRVFLLGDILDTRQMVHVGAQSAAMDFIGKLMKEFPAVHIIVGNHDMHLKHSRSITSLDALGLHPFYPHLTLHKEIEILELDNIPVLMLPYHQNEMIVKETLEKLHNERKDVNDIVTMTHLSINSAISNRKSALEYLGYLDRDLFSPFKRTFSGHFHCHQTLETKGGPITYVGSPMQFTFGDINDEDRGGILYYPNQDTFELKRNPKGVNFIEIPIDIALKSKKGKAFTEMKEKVEDKFVLLTGNTSRKISVTQTKEYEKARNILISCGASNVRRAMQSTKQEKRNVLQAKSSDEKKIHQYQLKDLINQYVDYRHKNNTVLSNLDTDGLIEYGKNIMEIVDEQERDHDSGTIFEADIKKIEIENFLGVSDIQTLNLEEFPNGIWYIQGSNGSGKSTIAEAITWCLFGQLLRSDTKADFVINDKAKKNCRVKVEFKNGKSIERFRKYKDLGGSGFRIYDNGVYQEELDKGKREAAQQILESTIGISFSNFIRTVALVDDTARSFVSATSKRRQIIEELLGFGKFEQYLIQARQNNRNVKESINIASTKIQSLEENIKTSLLRIDKQTELKNIAKQKLDEIENNQDSSKDLNTIDILTKEYEKQKEISELSNTVLLYRKFILNHDRQLSDLFTKICEIKSSLVKLASSKATDKMHHHIDKLQGYLESHYNRIFEIVKENIQLSPKVDEFIKELEKDKENCFNIISTIKQHCNYDSSASESKKIIANEEDLTNQLDKYNSSYQLLKEEQHPNEIDEFCNKHSITKEKLQKYSNEWNDSVCVDNIVKENTLKSKLDAAISMEERKEGGEFETEIDVYDKLIEDEKEQIQEYKDKIISLQNEIKELENIQEIYDFWEKAFGKGSIVTETISSLSMRDYVLQDSLEELNVTLKQSLEYLCDDGVYLHELDTSIDSNFSFSGSEYGKRSSGERRRTALALFFALIDLTRARSSHQTQFVILDEIFDALDSSGQDAAHKLIQRLHEGSEYSSGIRKIFVITHSPITAGICHTLKVSKSTNGTEFHPFPLPAAQRMNKE